MNTPLVSVVLLSHNRPRSFERALASVLDQSYSNLEVLVVDNRSASSEEIVGIASRVPAIRLISHSRNLGFTGGMNSGIRETRGEYVYLTEDDIELEPDVIATLVDHMARNVSFGIAAPVMLNRESGTVRCAGGHVTLGQTYTMKILAGDAIGKNDCRAAPYGVSYVPGASMMVRASVFRTLGAFRDEFFMYGEDVEFCLRVRRCGLEIAVVPEARITHEEPTPRVPTAIEFHKIKNFASLYFIHAPLRVLPVFVLRYGAAGLVRAYSQGRGFLHLRAWTWALGHAPRLLLERFQPLESSAAGSAWR